MTIAVKVKTGKRETTVEKTGDSSFAVSVKAAPEKGKANEAVIAALAKYFDVAKSNVRIVSGHASALKRIVIG
ncbi:MAG: hypothetical protein A3C85_00815 [Candidatus Doudnabacteria bacterium RIFCSPHIGHO2_02_FULL_48_21]|uniref:Uncharacterized protein n=1 Tax=Candidatus Doudnabacteria bacterium RIFCSPLOWO2_02_FULL_48_13 TaxID=1817845 RepID=A0A1F5QB63_9BACT|nr:MAG: hypothetical protein A3K05_04805 [Candidatus Doudnabacteria bacterium RIFCSPHIGHO2_01_48_18]OGE77304.1 MAG: hypothetical protein A2668_02655 [Candidatus Doudnabacteria bacterium RIFCSPHIGHO2_01_FULL_48_180]OGE91015.1 MAG: hypothetical protein A3F44_01675 [Candidatus Doudnabacteria bacterium RIFCSPHIGHO2_12_FULL_47_25]OGE92844.1 MAG: hypothetical protein A3C85_00815 [Candidatus Doudnabacteria bacterium RIFCSPHIGHO2_02_FULL_48_21]OGE96875.1 MAG: hypothetical protein A3A83_04050 [Candidatu